MFRAKNESPRFQACLCSFYVLVDAQNVPRKVIAFESVSLGGGVRRWELRRWNLRRWERRRWAQRRTAYTVFYYEIN